jgi:uncharacterized protein YqcC (DUF446 family)
VTTEHARLAALADDLERTMRAIGAWSEPAPPLLPYVQPFAMDTMPFVHWLQLVLVPRMRAIAANGEPLPMRSNLAPHAVREFDGDEERMAPLFAVLRAIDDVCPPFRAPAPAGDRRRLVAAAALIVLGLGWLVVALQIGTWGARVAANLFPARVFQTWTGTTAPGRDFQPLRITVAAEITGAGTLNLRDGNLVVIRSMATMANGPTAPLRFRVTTPPAPTDIAAWLATYGVPAGPPADAAVAEVLAVLRAANTATTPGTLHDVRVDGPTQPTADALLVTKPQTPEWVEIGVTVIALLLGLVPITIGAVRYARGSNVRGTSASPR